MYQGLQAVGVKGSGLSGYVERSRVHTTTARRGDVTSAEGSTGGLLGANPLELQRTKRESEAMAVLLADHKARRDVRLKIVRYQEQRRAEGIEEQVLEREAAELHTSLMDALSHSMKEKAAQQQKKSAEAFAAAFGVSRGSFDGVSSAVDYTAQKKKKEEQERQRRDMAEAKVAAKIKRLRTEGDEHDEGDPSHAALL